MGTCVRREIWEVYEAIHTELCEPAALLVRQTGQQQECQDLAHCRP